jgi:hypothetical protein
MRTFLLFGLVILVLTSCSKYQYYTLSSENVPKDKKHQFVVENDSCRIIYNFSGAKGPVSICIFNKMQQPLQVDWKRSAVIVGDSSTSFFQPEMKFSGEVERNRYAINQDVNGVITQQETIDFIPPQSSVTKQTRWISSKFLKLNNGEGQEIKTAQQKIKLYKFTKENSPVLFRTYLTLISGSTSFHLDNSFYANEMIETHTAPGNFGVNTADRFYIRGKTDFGKVSTAVFGLCLTVLLIAAL